jgi:hypothetical protein
MQPIFILVTEVFKCIGWCRSVEHGGKNVCKTNS